VAFKHQGFWKCMDTQRDKFALTELWGSHQAPWTKSWSK
jgi:glucose-1-phosphate cytidylyltransferase